GRVRVGIAMEQPMSMRNQTIALGVAGVVAGVLTLGTTAFAGPIPTGTAAVKQVAGGKLTDIAWRGEWGGGWRGGWGGGWRGGGWRGGWGGPGLALGLATGALIGAAVASPYYYGPGYAYGGYYGGPVYAAPYAYGVPVYAPGYYGGYGY